MSETFEIFRRTFQAFLSELDRGEISRKTRKAIRDLHTLRVSGPATVHALGLMTDLARVALPLPGRRGPSVESLREAPEVLAVREYVAALEGGVPGIVAYTVRTFPEVLEALPELPEVLEGHGAGLEGHQLATSSPPGVTPGAVAEPVTGGTCPNCGAPSRPGGGACEDCYLDGRYGTILPPAPLDLPEVLEAPPGGAVLTSDKGTLSEARAPRDPYPEGRRGACDVCPVSDCDDRQEGAGCRWPAPTSSPEVLEAPTSSPELGTLRHLPECFEPFPEGAIVEYVHPGWGYVTGRVLAWFPGELVYLVQDLHPHGAREYWPDRKRDPEGAVHLAGTLPSHRRKAPAVTPEARTGDLPGCNAPEVLEAPTSSPEVLEAPTSSPEDPCDDCKPGRKCQTCNDPIAALVRALPEPEPGAVARVLERVRGALAKPGPGRPRKRPIVDLDTVRATRAGTLETDTGQGLLNLWPEPGKERK